ncbi:hypothetical protein MLD38_001409 [Melastoma candidum]|uniref:Uncharacterized protein n=1 Tax=Melastoma candidum TaxID=119954 RepID=A0ACB9SES3_9MYRT|nr:hypothetical protein MLD38_001409 [Melastoma candidum]
MDSDNYGSPRYPYPYSHQPHPSLPPANTNPYPPPYGYPQHPPPSYGPPPTAGYGYPQYPPPTPSPGHSSGHLGYHPYPPPGQPPPPTYPYGYPPPASAPPQPSLEYSSSFQYGPSHYHYQQPPDAYPPLESYPQTPSRAHSFSTHQLRQDSLGSSGGFSPGREGAVGSSGSYRPMYPPLDDLMSGMRISDQFPSAPASPPAPSVMPPETYTPTHGGHAGFYGYPNDSFSSSWEENYSGPHDASGLGPLVHSTSLNGSQHGSQHGQSTQIVPFSKGSLKYLLLHGDLDIWVNEAKNLPNMDMFHKTLGDVFSRLPGNVTGKIEGMSKITSDPYVSITVASATIGRTYVMSNSENPVWRQHFHVPVAHHAAEVHFLVKDSDFVGSQLIGVVAIPVEQIYSGERIEGTYPILNNNGKPCKPGAVLSLSIQYIPMKNLTMYHHGVGTGSDHQGVPGTYFPLRKGGSVTLYQDAHVPDGLLPNIVLDNGMYYAHGKCWHDIFDAIRQARRLIYIAGWSVWHKVRLVRDAGFGEDSSLGELLRIKSREGVRVLLLVWDDPTSRSILGYKTDGIMQTHDEETRRFFKHSSVQVLLCPRVAGKRHSWVKQREVGTIYTHHQKTVILDADAGYNRRKIIAFVGGLDLCDGRYDTPQHPIFRTLETVHKDDYHNPSFSGNTVGCPREPWHDLHSKIDGPAAYDVLTNFEERWYRASKPSGIKKLKMTYDDALLSINTIPEIIGIADASYGSERDPESWHVQIFRSIDSSSVKGGFPKDPKDAPKMNLVCGKNVLIDMSIHRAYVKAIRAAQQFIYIENQYFIGSSYNWSQFKDLGANNLIPMEIALKIADKIRANERFAAYIVIPMWPEGVPTGAATQRILFWQHKTMQMMYETIHKALVEVGLEDAFSPQDFLNFFCLGNRESSSHQTETSTSENPQAVNPNTPQAQCKKSRRFMIYVHSKGMIVDDEYVILGSANINQRSMEGTRDTEIAMGAYQPQHTWGRKSRNPRGQIHGYRMSLWAEHIGGLEECFLQPESLECVRRVRQLGEMNWKQFAAEEVTEMKGHLMKYPVEVDRKGKVRPIPGQENFPDVGGNITGSFLAIQENLTI